LIRQLKAAIAGVALGTGDVGYLHFSLGFCACSGATNHQTEKSSLPLSLAASTRSFQSHLVQETFCIRLLAFVEPHESNRPNHLVTQDAHRDHGNTAVVVNRNLMAVFNTHSDVVFPDNIRRP
jgi:hypothetical protein